MHTFCQVGASPRALPFFPNCLESLYHGLTRGSYCWPPVGGPVAMPVTWSVESVYMRIQPFPQPPSRPSFVTADGGVSKWRCRQNLLIIPTTDHLERDSKWAAFCMFDGQISCTTSTCGCSYASPLRIRRTSLFPCRGIPSTHCDTRCGVQLRGQITECGMLGGRFGCG